MRAIFGNMAMLGWLAASAHAPPCRGPITPEGERLAQFLDDSDATRHWLAGWHLNWRTIAGFRHHPGAWLPDGAGDLRCCAHAVTWP
ncbi:MAG TPA: hypothetical protein VGI78_19470 [Acetobacteraceae bacterium]